MTIYELRPPVVDAVQWTGDNVDEMLCYDPSVRLVSVYDRVWLEIDYPDGRPQKVRKGAYIFFDRKQDRVVSMDKHMFEVMYKEKEADAKH